MQINRFCASGLDAVNLAAAQVMAGQQDMAIGGGVESMSRVGMGASGGAWPVDPAHRDPILLHAAGHLGRPHRHEIRLLPRRRRRLRGREPEARRARPGTKAASPSPSCRCSDVNGLTILDRDEHMRPADRHAVARRSSSPSFVQMGEMGGFDAVAIAAHPEVECVNHVHHAGNSSGIVDGAAAVLVGIEGGRREARA